MKIKLSGKKNKISGFNVALEIRILSGPAERETQIFIHCTSSVISVTVHEKRKRIVFYIEDNPRTNYRISDFILI